MGNILFNGIEVDAQLPVDLKQLTDSIATRNAISTAVVYEGMIVYVKNNNRLYVYTGADGTNNAADWEEVGSGAGGSLAAETVSANATLSRNTLYVIGANALQLTMPATPSVGDKVYISNLNARTATEFVQNGSDLIMGLSENLELDNEHASFTWLYSGAANGWVIIGPDGGGQFSGGSASAGEVGTNTLSTSDGTVSLYAVNVIPSGTSGLNISIPTDITNGDWFEIANLSGETDNNIQRGSFLIQGESTDLLLDDATASFRLTFINATTGWVVTGAN